MNRTDRVPGHARARVSACTECRASQVLNEGNLTLVGVILILVLILAYALREEIRRPDAAREASPGLAELQLLVRQYSKAWQAAPFWSTNP